MLKNTAFEIIAIASSAGGLAAVTEILSTLPGDFPAAVDFILPLNKISAALVSLVITGVLL